MTNILIVEDEKAIADLLEVYLKNEIIMLLNITLVLM